MNLKFWVKNFFRDSSQSRLINIPTLNHNLNKRQRNNKINVGKKLKTAYKSYELIFEAASHGVMVCLDQ